ncbi:MAG: hypothetical protein H7067_08770, partial [Burkholderiales bacterium]|nr:hypothetical protein [Opitutaceae bacterium]
MSVLVELTQRLRQRLELASPEIETAAGALADAAVGEADKAEFLRALSDKGETAAEVAAFSERIVVPEGSFEMIVEDICMGTHPNTAFCVGENGIDLQAGLGVHAIPRRRTGWSMETVEPLLIEAIGPPVVGSYPHISVRRRGHRREIVARKRVGISRVVEK